MQCKSLIFGILAIVAVSETRILGPTVQAPSRRGSWRRKTSLSISVPNGPGRGRLMGTPKQSKVSHSLSLNNLSLQPGETKVITQRLVVRRLPSGNHVQGKPLSHNRRRGGSGRGLHSRSQAPRIGSSHGQRGSHPTITPQVAGPQHNGLFLLSRMPSGSRWNQPRSNGHNGLANIQLPVIDLSRVAKTQHSLGTGGRINSPGNSAGHYQNGGHGIGAPVFGQHSKHTSKNTGVNRADIARAILTGNADVIVVQAPVSTPVSLPSNSGRNLNNLKQSNIAGGAGNSAFNSKFKANGVVVKSQTFPPVQTTMEPGEDPPEVP